MLKGLTARRCLVATLYLIVCELDEGIVLLGQLGGQHGLVALPQLVLALLDHALADELHLLEREQGLLAVTHQVRRAVRAARALRSHLGSARLRILHAFQGGRSDRQLFALVQSLDLVAQVLGHFVCKYRMEE